MPRVEDEHGRGVLRRDGGEERPRSIFSAIASVSFFLCAFRFFFLVPLPLCLFRLGLLDGRDHTEALRSRHGRRERARERGARRRR
jgi:hypothetical protein